MFLYDWFLYLKNKFSYFKCLFLIEVFLYIWFLEKKKNLCLVFIIFKIEGYV